MQPPESTPEIARHVIRVVGPPGSGKSLLITSLQEALRTLGVRSAAVVPLGDPGTGTAAISVAVSTGSRSTIDREVPLDYLATVVGWIDPSVEVVLAEDYVESGAVALEVRPAGAEPLDLVESERFAVVAPEEVALRFAADGPGYTAGIAERIVLELLGREPLPVPAPDEPQPAPPGAEPTRDSLIARLFHRFRR